MSNDVMIPDDLQGPSTYFRDHNVQTERLGDGIDGVGMTMIGVQGKEFYLRHKGKIMTIINGPSNPPTAFDKEAAKWFEFVILRKAERRSHTFYKDGYRKGDRAPPTCASTDGIAPDDDAKEKQADLCDLCPQHEWKVQSNGREGRACADNLRLAILPMEHQMKALLGEPIREACLFRIPAASLTALADLGDLMRKRFGPDTPYCNHIIRATFKHGVEWPQFEYQVIRFLKDEECAYINELRETPQAYRILGLTPEGKSLVRRGTIQLSTAPTMTTPHLTAANPVSGTAIAEKLAAERAARIAAVRAPEPKTIEAKAEEVNEANFVDLVQPPAQPVATPAEASVKTSVPQSSADIDALVAAMRPKPPGA